MPSIFAVAFVVLSVVVIVNSITNIILLNKVIIKSKHKRELHERDHGVESGTVFPKLKFKLITGEEFDLVNSSRKGTIVLFSSTSCSACKTVFPHINAFMKKNPDINMLILINGDSEKSAIELVRDYNLQIPVSLLSLKDMEPLRTSIFPFAYFIDSQGIVITKGVVNNKDIDILAREAIKNMKFLPESKTG